MGDLPSTLSYRAIIPRVLRNLNIHNTITIKVESDRKVCAGFVTVGSKTFKTANLFYSGEIVDTGIE